MKTYIKLITAFILMAITGSCSLGLQDEFEFEPDSYIENDPFINLTAWEFIQTRITPRDDNNQFKLISNTSSLEANGDNLDFFIAAIKKLGMENFYNQTMTANRTYLFLNNNAFSGTNNSRDIARVIRGSNAGAIADNSTINPDTVFDNWTPQQLNQLKAVLLYNIVDEYVTQHTIPRSFEYFLYDTFLPAMNVDASGAPIGLSDSKAQISFSRFGDARTTIRINETGAPLPDTALTGNTNIRRHNYVVSNGIGHFVNELHRYQPYSLYSNFPID